MNHVRSAIDEADVIIALATGENPNVYYELGWARREAIILVRDKNLPFDIRGDRYWVYGGLSQDELTVRLREAIEQSLARSPTSKQAQLEAQIKQFFSTPLRHVDEVNLFDQLGVWRSPEASIQSREPAYVSRCSDAKLEKAIESRKITVVKGPSKAGKSRSAAQALRAVAGNRVLLIPRPGLSNSLAVVISLAIQIANAAPDQWHILWLDDLDKYLRASLLEHSDIEHLISSATLATVATIRTQSLQALQESDDDYAKSAQHLLVSSEMVEVPGVLTQSEREEAQTLYPKLPLGPSLGESFVAAPTLRARLDEVRSEDVESVAIVRAAIDIQRLGVSQAVGLDEVRLLHRAYVIHLNPQTVYEPGNFEKSLIKALSPISRHSALLLRDTSRSDEDRFSAPDFLVEHIENRGEAILSAVWTWAVGRLRSGSAAFSLAAEAVRRKEAEWAKQAWRKGGEFDHALSLFNLGLALEGTAPPDAVEECFRRAGQLGVVQAKLALADFLRKTQRTEKALEVLEEELTNGSLWAGALLCSYFDADNRPTDHERVCRRAIELGSAWHAHELGKRVAARGASQEAIEIFEKGVDNCITNEEKWPSPSACSEMDSETRVNEVFRLAQERSFTSDPRTTVSLGRALESLGAIAIAERAYRFLQSRRHIVGSLELARLFHNIGRKDEASSLARDLAEEPSSLQRILSGDLTAGSGHELLGLVVLTIPNMDRKRARQNLASVGMLFKRLGQTNFARSLWLAGFEQGSAECAWELAKLLADGGDPAQYQSMLRKAAEMGSARAAGTLGFLLKEKGNVEEAEKLLRQASGSKQQRVAVAARSNLGVMFHRQRRLKEAEDEYRWVVENAEDTEAAKYAVNLGNMLAYLAQDRYLDAAEAYIEAIDRGDSECAHLSRGCLKRLYEEIFPLLVKDANGRVLLALAQKLNRREISTPRVLVGVVLGLALTDQLDAAKALRAQLRQLESARFDEIEAIIASEIQADSPAGRALHLLESI